MPNEQRLDDGKIRVMSVQLPSIVDVMPHPGDAAPHCGVKSLYRLNFGWYNSAQIRIRPY